MWPLLIFILFLLIFKDAIQKPELYPPGPPLIPVMGNLLSLWLSLKKFKYHHNVWQEWSKKYGSILGLRLGNTNVVVVSGRDMIKEVSSREVFDGRPNGFFYLLRSFNKKLGLVFSDGATWHKTRRMVLKCLKYFGYGSRSMEVNISEECKALIELRMVDAGSPVVVNHMFDVCIVNILWKLVAGKRDQKRNLSKFMQLMMDIIRKKKEFVDCNYKVKSTSIPLTPIYHYLSLLRMIINKYDLSNKQLTILCDLITRSFKVVDMSGGILNFLPFLRYIMPNLIGYTELNAIHNSLYDFLRTTIQDHQNTIDVKNPRDVIDMFLIEMNTSKNDSFSLEELQVICLDLLEAGVETVSNTAVFMLLHIVRNQEIQRKLQHEIEMEIGFSRRPTLSDRSKMLYTEAVLLETLRISSVAAVGIPHMALEDARLGPYTIPKGTFVLLAIHDLHNGIHWRDSSSFRPERFLTKEGNLIQDEWLMPFGCGKRRCIGEGLARSELFMFLTYLLQRFNLKVPEGDALPCTEPIDGVTLSAKEFRIIFEPRNQPIGK